MLSIKCFVALAALLPVALSSPMPEQTPAPEVVKRAPSSWVHPGVLNSQQQLDFVKGKVAGTSLLHPVHPCGD